MLCIRCLPSSSRCMADKVLVGSELNKLFSLADPNPVANEDAPKLPTLDPFSNISGGSSRVFCPSSSPSAKMTDRKPLESIKSLSVYITFEWLNEIQIRFFK